MSVKIKSNQAINKMRTAGKLLAEIFKIIKPIMVAGTTTAAIDSFIESEQSKRDLISQSKGYHGYRHVSCISINDVVVHGVPRKEDVLQDGDVVTVDVCAAWQGYCADMARCFVIGGKSNEKVEKIISTAKQALNAGIKQARVGNRLFDISAAIQTVVEKQNYGIVRDFAGHGIGKNMHEEPDILNFGTAGTGMRLKAGMTFAIEPMITADSEEVFIDKDGWTARTKDASLAVHVEDTVLITENGPEILTRPIK